MHKEEIHMYEQWNKAVVHLECATDSRAISDQVKLMDEK